MRSALAALAPSGLLLATVLATWLVACGSERPAPAEPRPSLDGVPAFSAEAYDSPATYHFHPKNAAPLLARLSLPDGSTLLAGQGGERWLVTSGGTPTATAETAVDVAPEDLASVMKLDSGGFLFLGRSGTAYESKEPLGPFVRSSAPAEPLVRARAAGGSLVGVRKDGALVRSDTSLAAWQKVGPEGVRFEDVALAPSGQGLALAVPEALYKTTNFGATWQPLSSGSGSVSTRGARALAVDGSGALLVSTVLGSQRVTFADTGPAVFLPAAPVLPRRAEILGAPPPLGPSAASLASGRAVLLGDQLFELRSEAEPGVYRLVKGTFGGALAASPFPYTKGCLDVRVAGSPVGGHVVYLACARQKASNVTQVLEFSRSADGGKTFVMEPYLVEGRMSDLELAASGSGDLVVSGICPSAAGGPGCRPAGVHVRKETGGDAGAHLALVPAATPALSGTALGLAFSHDGKTAFALGRRSKSDSLAVFVSHDGGANFEPRDVETLTAADDDESRARGKPLSVDVESLAAAEDGTLAFVVNRRGKRSWLVVDDDGHPLALAKPPVDSARIGAAGQRGVAFDPASSESWESLDGGASWTPLGKLPVDPCVGSGDGCGIAVACVARGCAFGEVLSRIGWREARARALLSPAKAAQNRRAIPKVGTPFSCTLDPSEWRRIDDAVQLPVASEAAIGKAAWFVLRRDPATSMVEFITARFGPEGTVERATLLAPAKKPSAFAFTAIPQVEGAAALRYPLPQGQPKGDGLLKNVEVAWVDLIAGHSGHAVIANGGAYRPEDYAGTPAAPQIAKPALLSVASGGVYVRLHASLRDDQPTYFLDGHAPGSIEAVPPVQWPEELSRTGVAEMIHVGRSHVPLRFVDSAVVRATKQGQTYTFDAVALGSAHPGDFGWQQDTFIAYSGDRLGRGLQMGDAQGKSALALLYPLRDTGPVVDEPVRLPTQIDLAATPRACTPQERKTTPRVVAPSLPGTRHPVIVTDAVEPMQLLLTDDAVLHGTPSSPCGAAYDALIVSTEVGTPSRMETAILPLDALERSWIFRASRAKGQSDVPSGVEYRPMNCRLDPNAEVPIEVFRERNALVEPP